MRQGSAIKTVLEWVVTIVAALFIAVLLRLFVFQVYLVPSGSMLETIQEGDRLIGEKVSYHFTEPEAGDVVTFQDPEDSSMTLIKRVIATGGQTVDLQDGVVYVDGQALDEPYTLGKPSEPLGNTVVPGGISYPYTVPEGSVWVMGDNRTNSLDSRYFGAVSVDKISSHAVLIYWPLGDARGL
ncbi:MAG: signal peptidase I [Atopobiaceae bacterium]|jgi:signal peptidase I